MAIGYRDWIRNRVRILKEHFLLHEWNITLFFEEETNNPDTGGTTGAAIDIDTRYLNAQLRVYPVLKEAWDAEDTDTVVNVLVHELSHILTEPLFEAAWETAAPGAKTYVNNIREQQTQRTSLVILKGIPKSLYKKDK